MCYSHKYIKTVAGVLICTVCGLIATEIIEGKEPQLHTPHHNYQVNTHDEFIPLTVSGTASTVAGPVTFSRM